MSQQQRVYGKPLAVIESSKVPLVNSSQLRQPAQSLLLNQHDPSDKNHHGTTSQQMSNLCEDKQRSNEKSTQELASSTYFGTSKTGAPDNAPKSPSKRTSSTIDDDYTSLQSAWISLETELSLKKAELQNALHSLSEKEKALSILKTERDFARAELRRKKSEQLKTEAILVGLQDRNAQYKKRFDELFGLVNQCYDLRDEMFDNNMASGEEYENLTKMVKQLSNAYEENLKKLDAQNTVLLEQLLKVQKELDEKEGDLNNKESCLQEMQERFCSLESRTEDIKAHLNKTETENNKLRQNMQLLLEEHSKKLQETENIQASYEEIKDQHSSLIHTLEEMGDRFHNFKSRDDEGCSEKETNPVLAIERSVELLAQLCRATEEKLQEALDAVRKLEDEKELLWNDKRALEEKMATFESLVLEKQDLERELMDEKLKSEGLVEALCSEKEEYCAKLQKLQDTLQSLETEKQGMLEDFTERMEEMKNEAKALEAELRSVTTSNMELQQEIEAVKGEREELAGRIDAFVADVEEREKVSRSFEERIDNMSKTIAELELIHEHDLCKLEASVKEVESLKKSAAEEAAAASAKIEALTSQLEQKTKDVKDLNEELNANEALVSELREESRISTNEQEQLKSAVEKHQKTINDLIAELEMEKCRPEMCSQGLQMSQTEESERNKELQLALKEARDTHAELEIHINRMKHEFSELSERYERECQEYRSKLHETNSNYVTLEKQLSEVRVEHAHKEKQVQSLTQQLHDMKMTESITKKDMQKAHEAEIQKLQDERHDLRVRLDELQRNLDEARSYGQEQRYQIQRMQEENKSSKAKLEKELAKQKELFNNLNRKHTFDALKHEEEVNHLMANIQKAKQSNTHQPIYKVEPTEQPHASERKASEAAVGAPTQQARQRARAKVQPVVILPAQTSEQPKDQTATRRSSRKSQQPPHEIPAQKRKRTTQRDEVYPFLSAPYTKVDAGGDRMLNDSDNMFDSDSSIDHSEVESAISSALKATSKKPMESDTSPPETFTTVKEGQPNMPPPKTPPQSKKRKFFTTRSEWSSANLLGFE